MKKLLLIILPLALFIPNMASAWTATYLGGGNWAIGCANGQNYSYSGGSAGLDTVGPALCPGGVIENLPGLKANMQKTKASFPPNGYPCLGCKPCPEPDQENYCSTTDATTVAFNLGKYSGKELAAVQKLLGLKQPKPVTSSSVQNKDIKLK